jgi:hypothetical protein
MLPLLLLQEGGRPIVEEFGSASCWLASKHSLFGLSVLRSLVELGNLDLDGLLNASLQLTAVTQLEEELKPDKYGGQEDGLNQIVKQGRSSTLKKTVPNELGNPADNVNGQGSLEGGIRVLDAEEVGKGSAGKAHESKSSAGHWL